MFSSRLKNKPRSIALFIIMLVLLLAVQIHPPVQATVTRETSFSSEVNLNKPGVTYDLSPLLKYEKEGSVKIVEDNDTSKYFIYNSHFQKELVVTLAEEDYTAYYPSGDSLDEIKIEGLGIKLSIPTESKIKQTDY